MVVVKCFKSKELLKGNYQIIMKVLHYYNKPQMIIHAGVAVCCVFCVDLLYTVACIMNKHTTEILFLCWQYCRHSVLVHELEMPIFFSRVRGTL